MATEKWDYCQCVLFRDPRNPEDPGNVLVVFAGRPDKDTHYEPPKPNGDAWDVLMTALADLGEQGWEMVGSTSGGGIERFWFKRPREIPVQHESRVRPTA